MVAAAPIEQILRRIVGTTEGDLPPEVARFFLNLSFTQADVDRVGLLSEKANEGELTAEEREELAAYVLVGDFLTLMQTRARGTTKRPFPAK